MRKFKVAVNGVEYEVAVEEIKGEAGSAPVAAAPAAPMAAAPRPAAKPQAKPAASAAPAGGASGQTITAPMPGTIVDIDVNVGDEVAAGQKLLVLEAMKMENEVTAPEAGTVREISVVAGAMVNAGDVLVVLG